MPRGRPATRRQRTMTNPPSFDCDADPARARAEDEAADWLIALAETPDDAGLLRRFESWLAASDMNGEIWARTRRSYGLAGQGAPRHGDAWADVSGSRGADPDLPTGGLGSAAVASNKTTRPRRIALGAAAMALAACLAFAVVPDALLRMQADVVTATAEQRDLNLADGSRVHLAPESAVEIAFTDDRRQVRLIKGRAFFAVAPNPDRPFRVSAGGTTATVLGTAFDVRLGDDGARIAVREGRVRVEDASTAPPTRADLTPGDWMRVTWNGASRRGHARANEVASWTGGNLIARDRPAGEIVDSLRPYFQGAILVQSRRFSGLRVSGIYSLRDPAMTLADLAASHGAVMRRVSPWLLVVTDW